MNRILKFSTDVKEVRPSGGQPLQCLFSLAAGTAVRLYKSGIKKGAVVQVPRQTKVISDY